MGQITPDYIYLSSRLIKTPSLFVNLIRLMYNTYNILGLGYYKLLRITSDFS